MSNYRNTLFFNQYLFYRRAFIKNLLRGNIFTKLKGTESLWKAGFLGIMLRCDTKFPLCSVFIERSDTV